MKIAALIGGGALALLSACSNPTQTAAVTTAAIDAGSCVLAVAPPVTQIANTSASNTDKALAAGSVAVQAAVTVAPCRDMPNAIAAAVAAGKSVSVTPVAVTR